MKNIKSAILYIAFCTILCGWTAFVSGGGFLMYNKKNNRGNTGTSPSPNKGKQLVKRVELICDNCNNTFYRLASVIRVKEQKCCSKKCMGELFSKIRNNKIELNCTYCGKLFKKRKDHLYDRNYCSKKCCSLDRMVEGAKWRDKVKISAYMVEWNKNNKDKVREGRIRNKEKNDKTHQLVNSARRAKKKLGDFTLNQWEQIKEKYNYSCLCCGKSEPEIKLTVDHVIPLKMNGAHNISNIQPLCKSCNCKKNAKHIDYRTIEK